MLTPRSPLLVDQVETRDLWKWVDLLTRDRKEPLHRRLPGQPKSRVEYVTVPSLWKQMVDSVASDNSGGGRGKASGGSRSPMDLALVSLLMEMQAEILSGLTRLGARARVEAELRPQRKPAGVATRSVGRPIDPQTAGALAERAQRSAADLRTSLDAGRYTHDMCSDLRQLAQLVVGTANNTTITTWVRRYRYWVTRAESALAGEEASVQLRPMRIAVCTCLAMWVTYEQAGETKREPALLAEFRDHHLQHLLCRACGADWRDDFDELTAWVEETEAEFGPATSWGQTVARSERMSS